MHNFHQHTSAWMNILSISDRITGTTCGICVSVTSRQNSEVTDTHIHKHFTLLLRNKWDLIETLNRLDNNTYNGHPKLSKCITNKHFSLFQNQFYNLNFPNSHITVTYFTMHISLDIRGSWPWVFLTFSFPGVNKDEFLLKISKQYPAERWWEVQKIILG